MASTTARATQHQQHQQQQQQQQALKCPRCDSSNTKFCYYNNYSLLQPRHFCKACKRYWTRGGTLRNVPVGGGCRKNKRIKKPSSSNPNPSPNPSNNNNELASSLSHANPLLYGLPGNPSEANLVYPRYNSRIPEAGTGSGYDLLNDIGLGFTHGIARSSNVLDSSLFFPNHLPFGSTNSCFSSSAVASLLGSTPERHSLEGFGPYNGGMMTKETKMGEDQTRMGWDFGGQNQMEQIGSLDPNSLMWNTTGVGAWLDPANIGHSVPSLI